MLIEATGIQEYIFGSNELAQNIGASELVRRSTVNWVRDCLVGQFGAGGHNFTGLDERKDPELGDDQPGEAWRAEVVYAGGGNAMLLFADDGEADAFARRLTEMVLRQAPGLHLVVQRASQPDGVDLATFHQTLRACLAQRKLDHVPSTPLLGLGVTAECVFTGAPATGVHPRSGLPVSAEVVAKLAIQGEATDRLYAQVPRIRDSDYDFVYNFDQLGEKGESTYLAVVHADGNRMGQRIKDMGREHRGDDRGYIRALRAFSESVQAAAARALQSTADLLLDALDVNEEGEEVIGGVVPVPGRHLPFRPIVFGGDDVTFVCEGRLGLNLATHYLDVYSSTVLSDKEPAHARAGVAVVSSHYPFSRAYDLAEDLCASAKKRIAEIDAGRRVTAIDWHFATSGLVRALGEIRAREYTTAAGSLLSRPLRLDVPAQDWRTWATFAGLVYKFQKHRDWARRRNKVKALRQALRDGPDAVRYFLATHRQPRELPEIPLRRDMALQGWQGGECGYFDAIEAVDYFVPLQGEV